MHMRLLPVVEVRRDIAGCIVVDIDMGWKYACNLAIVSLRAQGTEPDQAYLASGRDEEDVDEQAVDPPRAGAADRCSSQHLKFEAGGRDGHFGIPAELLVGVGREDGVVQDDASVAGRGLVAETRLHLPAVGGAFLFAFDIGKSTLTAVAAALYSVIFERAFGTDGRREGGDSGEFFRFNELELSHADRDVERHLDVFCLSLRFVVDDGCEDVRRLVQCL